MISKSILWDPSKSDLTVSLQLHQASDSGFYTQRVQPKYNSQSNFFAEPSRPPSWLGEGCKGLVQWGEVTEFCFISYFLEKIFWYNHGQPDGISCNLVQYDKGSLHSCTILVEFVTVWPNPMQSGAISVYARTLWFTNLRNLAKIWWNKEKSIFCKLVKHGIFGHQVKSCAKVVKSR